jgi:O-antigen/teichoic acid export membrane protein
VTSTAFVAASVAFVVNVVTSRILGPSARGEVAFVLQVAYFITPLILLGRDRGVLRKDEHRQDVELLLPVAALLLAGGVVFVDGLTLLALPVALGGAWVALQRGHALRTGQLATFTRTFLGVQGGVLGGTLLLAAMNVQTVAYWVLPYAAPALWVLANEGRAYLSRPPGMLRSTLRWSHLLPAGMASMIVLRADRLLLPALASYKELGLYVAVATASEPVAWFAQALSDHRVSRTGYEGVRGRLSQLMRDATVFIPLAGVMAAVTLLLILPLMGKGFVDARQLVVPLSLAAVTLALYRQVIGWLTGGRRAWLASACETATAAAALPIYAIAIDRAGALGAAWGSLGVYATGVVIGTVLLVDRGGGSPPRT